ncbi:hypothetical protein AB6806_23845 [Bosea sp. RCC_152_1]|uniref:capsid assembly protein n=1 Tax=Bosea sp. RCC_152_1 TaxID=3239228 RepID=UPI003524DC2E
MTTFTSGEAPAEAPAGSQPTQTANSSSAVAAALPTPVSGEPAPAQAAASTGTESRPEGLPEGFNSWADLAAAYQTLKADPSAAAASATPPADAGAQIEAKAAAAGVDLKAIDAEYTKDGKLSEKSYAEFAKAGLDRAFVDSYVRGQEALAAAEVADIQSVVGGEAEYKAITAWAKVNLPAGEVATLSDLMVNGDPTVAKLALAGLKARYEGSNGSEPTLLNGQNAPGGAVGFQSLDQMTTAMSDPRYSRDPAYRAEIEGRIAVTTAF